MSRERYWKISVLKDCTPYDFTYITFLKWQSYKNGEQYCLPELGEPVGVGERKVGMVIKAQQQGSPSWWNCTSWLRWLKNLYSRYTCVEPKTTHTHEYSNTAVMCERSLAGSMLESWLFDFTIIHHCHFYHWGAWVKETQDHLHHFFQRMTIYNYLKIKSLFKKSEVAVERKEDWVWSHTFSRLWPTPNLAVSPQKNSLYYFRLQFPYKQRKDLDTMYDFQAIW